MADINFQIGSDFTKMTQLEEEEGGVDDLVIVLISSNPHTTLLTLTTSPMSYMHFSMS